MPPASDGERLRVANVHDDIVRRRIVTAVGQASQPTQCLAAVWHAGMPEAHRREVREARVLVAAAVHDGHETVLVQPFEADHRWMEAKSIAKLDDVAIRNPDRWSGAIVGRIAVRDDGV